ncbi:16S rRNA (guanine(527)-N(7))-methyltransferase RsmG [Gordonia sp. TBRC 11910]|uniref:Ribosomal RNA small subunit methyltransferase G n=1 Tax=Gordonia asplenii TaxID=2725283 RepID=A0A848KV93_9ACTN|nr:16S rRNA (guanine(527)-N(7))-methyltransferase RsmG [Gordonia asplenii]NMO02586.1 16S rRNA (guanine(527)-N(7))-methyltransferase RsmG [Gordonia asplenii]
MAHDTDEPIELDPTVARNAPELAEQIFGAAVPTAEKYWDWLAGPAVVRGLVGPRETPRLWERHIMNCGVVGECLDAGERVVDIGSGAGLPGIPLAIARPDVRITLVEPLLRRATFLQEVVDDLGLDVTVVRGRAEEPSVIECAGGADVVTSRAVAPLDRLARWSAPLIRSGGRLVALKGSSAAEEIATHAAAARRVGLERLTVRECGTEVLSTPTIVIIGEKTIAAKGRGAKNSKPRRHRGSERG